MMPSQQRGAARYQAVRMEGLVADASPTRLVQVMFEQILAQLAIAGGCMRRIDNNLPLADVVAKGNALGKAIRLIDHLNASLDMERGQQVAANLRALYVYMLARLTAANVTNDAGIVAEVSGLIQKIKIGWDKIVSDKTLNTR